MLRRCPTTLIMLASALAFGLGSSPMSTRADALTSASNTSNTETVPLEFTLTTTQAIAGLAGSPPQAGSTASTPPQIALDVSPVSIVQPPSPSIAALQILSDSTGYYVANPTQLSVDTINSPNNGSTVTTQLLGLALYGQGLPAGASLTFALPFAQSVVGNPSSNFMPFTALDPSNGTTISQAPTSNTLTAPSYTIQFDGVLPPPNSSTTPPITESATPEPLSLLIWSLLAGIGLWRARTRRPYGPSLPLMAGK